MKLKVFPRAVKGNIHLSYNSLEWDKEYFIQVAKKVMGSYSGRWLFQFFLLVLNGELVRDATLVKLQMIGYLQMIFLKCQSSRCRSLKRWVDKKSERCFVSSHVLLNDGETLNKVEKFSGFKCKSASAEKL